MNGDYNKLLRAIYAIDTAIASFKNAPAFATYRGKMSSHYSIGIEADLRKSELSMETLLSLRDNAIKFCIDNGILNFYRQTSGYDAFEGVEDNQIFTFLSENPYREHADKSTVRRDNYSVFNDYSKSALSLGESTRLLEALPSTNLVKESDKSKLKHSEEAMKNLLGVVEGFDFSNCYDENGLVEIDFYDYKSVPFEARRNSGEPKRHSRNQYGRR